MIFFIVSKLLHCGKSVKGAYLGFVKSSLSHYVVLVTTESISEQVHDYFLFKDCYFLYIHIYYIIIYVNIPLHILYIYYVMCPIMIVIGQCS